MKTTSYLRSEELLAKCPGRLDNINAALVACYIAAGLKVPERLIMVDGGNGNGYNVTKGDK